MGNFLPKVEASKCIERTGNNVILAASSCINGFRESMEDAHCMVLPQNPQGVGRHIFGVFDGHSNATCSAFVAEHLPRALLELPLDATNEQIEDAFIAVDKQYASDDRGGGTTAAVVIVDVAADGSMTAIVCHTGDSRVTIMRGNEPVLITEDHKPDSPSERQRIEAAGGMVRQNRVDGQLGVARAFGDTAYKRPQSADAEADPRATKVICVPEIRLFPLRAGDVIMIACDGLYEGSTTNEMVVDFLQQNLSGGNRKEAFSGTPHDLATVPSALCEFAVRRGSKDNISCMLLQIGVDGTGYAERFGGALDLIPGTPPLRSSPQTLEAFTAMCKHGGVTVGEALQRRYRLWKKRTANALAPPDVSEMESQAFDMQDDFDVEVEGRYFGGGPTPGLDEAGVVAWFDRLAFEVPDTEYVPPAGGLTSVTLNAGGGAAASSVPLPTGDASSSGTAAADAPDTAVFGAGPGASTNADAAAAPASTTAENSATDDAAAATTEVEETTASQEDGATTTSQ